MNGHRNLGSSFKAIGLNFSHYKIQFFNKTLMDKTELGSKNDYYFHTKLSLIKWFVSSSIHN